MALQHFKISHRENRHVWEKNGNQLPVTYGAASQDDQNSKLEENTDDASESESAELKRDLDRQLRGARNELASLENGTHPCLVQRMEHLLQEKLIRQRENQIARDFQVSLIESEYEHHRNVALEQFEAKERQMKHSLIVSLQSLQRETEIAFANVLTEKMNREKQTSKHKLPLQLAEKIVKEDIWKISTCLTQGASADSNK